MWYFYEMSDSSELFPVSDVPAHRNMCRQQDMASGTFLTAYERQVGGEWVSVRAYDSGYTSYTFTDGTFIQVGKDNIYTHHADGSMTVKREDGSVETITAAFLNAGAAKLEAALLEVFPHLFERE